MKVQMYFKYPDGNADSIDVEGSTMADVREKGMTIIDELDGTFKGYLVLDPNTVERD